MSKSQKQIEQDKRIAGITRALKRAAKEARRIAKMHGTKVWVMKDGKIVGLEPCPPGNPLVAGYSPWPWNGPANNSRGEQ